MRCGVVRMWAVVAAFQADIPPSEIRPPKQFDGAGHNGFPVGSLDDGHGNGGLFFPHLHAAHTGNSSQGRQALELPSGATHDPNVIGASFSIPRQSVPRINRCLKSEQMR